MDLDEAKNLLSDAVKSELRDHAFGDCEIIWYKNDTEIAAGYFGGGESSVTVMHGENLEHCQVFKDRDAFELRNCFASEKVERNDETGPDDFALGRVMPGLTLEGVRKELEEA